MNDSTLIRLENLRALGKTPGELTASVGNSKQYWSDLLRGKKSFGETAARKIEEKLDLPRLFLDEDHGGLENQRSKNQIGDRVSIQADTEVRKATDTASMGAMLDTADSLCQTIPISMPYAPKHLKSAILLMGSLLGALDKRSKRMIGDLLQDLATDTDDAHDIAEKAAAIATVQKPVSKNMELNRAIRGRGEAVETDRAPLEKERGR